MARCIDADALDARVDGMMNAVSKHKYGNMNEWDCLNWMRDIIDKAPTVDTVPVVRCKDCYYQDKMLCYRICQRGGSPVYVEPEGFCKWGKPWGADDHGGKHEKTN